MGTARANANDVVGVISARPDPIEFEMFPAGCDWRMGLEWEFGLGWVAAVASYGTGTYRYRYVTSAPRV